MFPTRFRIAEFFGVPVYINFSFILILLMFLFEGANLLEGLCLVLVLLVSVVAHEYGHVLTAQAFGYPTRDITVSLIGGCASLIALPRKPSQEFLTAIAGPAVSFLLAGLAFLINVFIPLPLFLFNFFFYLLYFNIAVGIFNLLPGFPMDGGRVFRSFLCIWFSREKATYIAMIVGRIFAILLALSVFYEKGGGAFIRLFIAFMIWKEGYREYLLALQEAPFSWADYRAHVSPPPYGGRSEDCDIRSGNK